MTTITLTADQIPAFEAGFIVVDDRAEFVALTEPCDHDLLTAEECPVCDGIGRPILTLEWPTEHPNQCVKCGLLRWAWDSQCHCGYSIDGIPRIGLSGARVHVTDIVPIVDYRDDEGGFDRVKLGPEGYEHPGTLLRANLTAPDHLDVITLPVNAEPGQYVLIVEEIK